MGAFLDKPITTKETIVEESKSIDGHIIPYALSSMQGWRVQMEDAHIHKIGLHLFGNSLPPCSIGMFGVFDGHGGNLIANHAAQSAIDTFLHIFARKSESIANGGGGFQSVTNELLAQTLGQTFIVLDDMMRDLPEARDMDDNSGSTAVCALLTKDAFIVSNLGDSRCVIVGERGLVKFATNDHKPYQDAETTRITKAGGFVAQRRVNGDLAVSRGLGDYRYKQSDDLPPEDQIVSCMPDITVIPREKSDLFLILACDGVWDVMTNQDCGAFLIEHFKQGRPLQECVEKLLDHTLELNSRDNVTAAVIALPAAGDLYSPYDDSDVNVENAPSAESSSHGSVSMLALPPKSANDSIASSQPVKIDEAVVDAEVDANVERDSVKVSIPV